MLDRDSLTPIRAQLSTFSASWHEHRKKDLHKRCDPMNCQGVQFTLVYKEFKADAVR